MWHLDHIYIYHKIIQINHNKGLSTFYVHIKEKEFKPRPNSSNNSTSNGRRAERRRGANSLENQSKSAATTAPSNSKGSSDTGQGAGGASVIIKSAKVTKAPLMAGGGGWNGVGELTGPGANPGGVNSSHHQHQQFDGQQGTVIFYQCWNCERL